MGPRPPHRQFVPGMMPPMPHEQVMVAEKHDILRSTLADLGNDKMIKALDDLRMILQMIMQDCSRAGKTWSFEYCCHPARAEALIDFILALSLSKPTFEERLHLLYLINDVLFHCIRRQLGWMKDLILHRLVPLLRTVYHCPGANEMTKAKVNKVMTIWGDKNFFAPNIIHSIRENVYIPPPPHMPVLGPPGMQGMMPGFRPPFVPPGPMGPMSMPPMENPNPVKMPIQMPAHLGMPPRPHLGRGMGGGPYNAPAPLSSTSAIPTSGKLPNPTQPSAPPTLPASPPKRYYELPAGWMVTAHKNGTEPYTPIDPSVIQQYHQSQQKVPTADDLKEPLEDFYDGLDLADHSDTFEENTDGRVDRNGWEPDYLNGFYERIKEWSLRNERDMEKDEGKRKRRGSSRHSDKYDRRSRRYPDDRSPSRGRSPSRYKGSPERR
ncbi:hypothetical protein CLU79DRAFT_412160 [Phycomyces nitens]|nr:hypothetical protein CLU79DRAFT_412160 [Phycomyces nitens]